MFALKRSGEGWLHERVYNDIDENKNDHSDYFNSDGLGWRNGIHSLWWRDCDYMVMEDDAVMIVSLI